MEKHERHEERGSRGDPQSRSPATISHALQGVDFPTDKQGLFEHAKENGADESVLERIDDMPDMEYSSMADVFKGVGEADEDEEE